MMHEPSANQTAGKQIQNKHTIAFATKKNPLYNKLSHCFTYNYTNLLFFSRSMLTFLIQCKKGQSVLVCPLKILPVTHDLCVVIRGVYVYLDNNKNMLLKQIIYSLITLKYLALK